MSQGHRRTYAILLNIPSQPLYGGLTPRMRFVVHTWLKYIGRPGTNRGRCTAPWRKRC